MENQGRNEPKGMTPEEAAHEIEPGTPIRSASADDDPREELGMGQPESSAQKPPHGEREGEES